MPGMVIVLVIVVRIETILLLGNELLDHFMLVVFSLAIMMGNTVSNSSNIVQQGKIWFCGLDHVLAAC